MSTINGTVQSDGTCQFDYSATSSSTSTSYQQEVGYNPSTCQERVLTGSITTTQEATMASPTDTNTVAETPQTASSTGDSSDSVSPVMQPYSETGAAQTASSTSYSYAHTKTARNNAYKFKYDGWSTSGTPKPTFSTVSNGWGTGGAETFKNNDFEYVVLATLGTASWAACGFSTDTAVFKHNVHVYGYRDGSRKHTWSDSKSGGCSNLVHHRTSNGFGWTT